MLWQCAMTVAAVHDSDAGRDAVSVTRRLAELAVEDELLVVLGDGEHASILAGLRARLPRHDVVALAARPDPDGLLGGLLEVGSLPVVLSEARALPDLAARLAGVVGADRVVRVRCTATGADLCPVWTRPALN
jgi:hypothetical protein